MNHPRILTGWFLRLIEARVSRDALQTSRLALTQHLTRMLGCADQAEELATRTCRLVEESALGTGVPIRALLFDVGIDLALERMRERQGRNEHRASGISVSVVRERALHLEALLKKMSQVVESLPEPLRAVYVLRWSEALATRRIAKRLHLSRETVEARLREATSLCTERLGAREYYALRAEVEATAKAATSSLS